jgi:hypothetical protein
MPARPTPRRESRDVGPRSLRLIARHRALRSAPLHPSVLALECGSRTAEHLIGPAASRFRAEVVVLGASASPASYGG